MAFYYGTRLDAPGRRRLFGSINSGPTLYEAVMLGMPPATAAAQNGFDLRTRPGAQAVRCLSPAVPSRNPNPNPNANPDRDLNHNPNPNPIH